MLAPIARTPRKIGEERGGSAVFSREHVTPRLAEGLACVCPELGSLPLPAPALRAATSATQSTSST